jgi:hypothetical protein
MRRQKPKEEFMSKKLLLSASILLALTLPGTLAALQGPPEPGQAPPGRAMAAPPVMGTITSVGVDRFEIKKPDGSTQTILVSDQTHYRQRQQDQQQELKLEDLKVGDHVFVRGAPNADKQLVAESVDRVSEEMFQRFQSGNFGGPGGGQGGPGSGGFGPGGGRGGPGAGNRAGGEILSIDQNQIKVRGRQGERIIIVNDQTTYSKEGQTIHLKDLKVGDRIFAMGKEVNGQFVATEIRSGGMHQGRGGWQGRPQQ